MIIVEGPDGGGKTTLLERLSEDFALPIADRVVDKQAEAMVDLQQWVETNLDEGITLTLYDRHRLISEPIYGPVLRTEPHPGFEDLYWLTLMQKKFAALKPFFIFCLPPLDVVEKNCEGEDNSVVYPHISTIYWLYVNEAARRAGMDCQVWDYTKKDNGGPTEYRKLEVNLRDWMWRKGLLGDTST